MHQRSGDPTLIAGFAVEIQALEIARIRSGIIALVAGNLAKMPEGVRHAASVGELAEQRQRFVEQDPSLGVLTALPQQQAGADQQPRAGARLDCTGIQGAPKPARAFAKMAADAPEHAEGARELHAQLGLGMRKRPVES